MMHVTPMPEMLRETMAEFGKGPLDNWWSDLNEQARKDVIHLWRSVGIGQVCGVQVTGRFVEEDEADDDPELWHNDFYEYLVNHELCFSPPRVFHICTREPAARAAVSSGLIPHDFSCPLADKDCLMQRLLQFEPGKSVRLRVAFTPE